MRPETRYAHSGDVNIAYQVVGEGPRDLVVVPGWVSNIDLFWDEPHVARFLERLASFSRLILFDKRGTGLSDRVADMPSLETRMDDVRAVMDAASSEQAALFGYSEGGPMCALFAATYPARTTALIMGGSYARRMWAPDYSWGTPRDTWESFLDAVVRNWAGPPGSTSGCPAWPMIRSFAIGGRASCASPPVRTPAERSGASSRTLTSATCCPRSGCPR
jgi:pimeloyl-ACP methyl ester carboxylesterase